jgi:hypothetical protein
MLYLLTIIGYKMLNYSSMLVLSYFIGLFQLQLSSLQNYILQKLIDLEGLSLGV